MLATCLQEQTWSTFCLPRSIIQCAITGRQAMQRLACRSMQPLLSKRKLTSRIDHSSRLRAPSKHRMKTLAIINQLIGACRDLKLLRACRSMSLSKLRSRMMLSSDIRTLSFHKLLSRMRQMVMIWWATWAGQSEGEDSTSLTSTIWICSVVWMLHRMEQ